MTVKRVFRFDRLDFACGGCRGGSWFVGRCVQAKSLEMEEELRNLIPKQGVVLHELEEGRARPLGSVETPLGVETGVNKKPKKFKTVWHGFRGI